MPDDYALFQRILESNQIQHSGRAIIFDSAQQRVLVEKNLDAREGYVSFQGGSIKHGETSEECVIRELNEEIAVQVTNLKFRFVVENFIPFKGEYIHGIEMYYELTLLDEYVESQSEGFAYPWIDRRNLAAVDLRPTVVRDSILDGSFREVHHFVTKGE